MTSKSKPNHIHSHQRNRRSVLFQPMMNNDGSSDDGEETSSTGGLGYSKRGLLDYTNARSSDIGEVEVCHHDASTVSVSREEETSMEVANLGIPPKIPPQSPTRRFSWKCIVGTSVALMAVTATVALLALMLPSSDKGNEGMDFSAIRGGSSNKATPGPTMEPISLPTQELLSPTRSPAFLPTTTQTTSSTTPSPVSSAPTNGLLVAIPTSPDTFNATASISSGRLPFFPSYRFTPWDQVSLAHQFRIGFNTVGYNETTWNLPGTANRHDLNLFWEGQSFARIQSANDMVISAIALVGFSSSQWDCWINHYQNFSWNELVQVSTIEITVLPDQMNDTGDDQEGNNGNGNGNSHVAIGGRDVQLAMTLLGWTQDNWDTIDRFEYFFPSGPTSSRALWNDLSLIEQLAAKSICYTPELWDRIPLPEWNQIVSNSP